MTHPLQTVRQILTEYDTGRHGRLPLIASHSAVLHVVADAESASNGVCTLAQPTIAERACLSERHVRNVLRDLEEWGCIEVLSRGGGRAKAATIRVQLPAVELRRNPETDCRESACGQPVEPTRNPATDFHVSPVDNPVNPEICDVNPEPHCRQEQESKTKTPPSPVSHEGTRTVPDRGGRVEATPDPRIDQACQHIARHALDNRTQPPRNPTAWTATVAARARADHGRRLTDLARQHPHAAPATLAAVVLDHPVSPAALGPTKEHAA
jgi:hypothetical protein